MVDVEDERAYKHARLVELEIYHHTDRIYDSNKYRIALPLPSDATLYDALSVAQEFVKTFRAVYAVYAQDIYVYIDGIELGRCDASDSTKDLWDAVGNYAMQSFLDEWSAENA
jgi:hypothetical protein